MKKILFIDCGYSGISGDLMIARLAGIIGQVEMKHFLTKMLDKIMPNPNYSIDLITKSSSGISGYYLTFDFHSHEQEQHVKVSESLENEQISHDHGHSLLFPSASHHLHHHHHYSVLDMEKDLKLGLSVYPFSENAINSALSVLRLLVEAESQVHGVSIEKVHLHEIGSRDTILDICGAIFGLEKIGVFKKSNPVPIYISPISVGGGKVKCAHGIMPVPAPATSKLLEKASLLFRSGPVDFELATPTGVALLASLKLSGFLSDSSLTGEKCILHSGIGVGSLKFPNQANILRTFIYQVRNHGPKSSQKSSLNLSNNVLGSLHDVYKIETNVDDVRGEILGQMISQLISVGALDVSIISTITKKNRPGQLITVICHGEDIERLSSILILETGSLGVRILKSSRICLKREIRTHNLTIDNQLITIRMKTARDNQDRIIQQKLEYDDLAKISKVLKKPIRIVEQQIWNQITDVF